MNLKDNFIARKYLRELDLNDEFFDLLKKDYNGFSSWFERKQNEQGFVTERDGKITSLLVMKIEDDDENYDDFIIPFEPARRLKICTFKVKDTGFGIGKKFLKIVMNMAMVEDVCEVYFTVFDEYSDFIKFMKSFDFDFYTKKKTFKADGKEYLENVFVKKIRR